METKKYLQQVKNLDKEIRFRENEINALQARAKEIADMRGRKTRVDTECVDRRLDAVCETLDENIAEHRAAVCRLNETIIEISREIVKLKDLDEVMCLTLRYIQLMSWDDIASATVFSKRHLRRIHDRGIEHLDSLLNSDRLPVKPDRETDGGGAN